MFDVLDYSIAKRKGILFLLLGLLTVFYLVLCAINIFLALALVIVATAAFCFYKNVEWSFFGYILILPFVYSPVFSGLPEGLSLLKLELIICALSFLLFFLSKKWGKTSTLFKVFSITLMLLYTIGWVRSGDYALRALTVNLAGQLPVINYLVNYVSWTVLSFFPLVMIVVFMKNKKGIEKVILLLTGSTLIIAAYLLLIFLFKVSDRSNFETIRTELGQWIGMHGNDIINYFTLAFPVVLAWAFSKKSRLSYITLFGITAGTLLSFSRTGYFVVLFGFFFYLFLTRKLKWMPVIVILLVVALLISGPNMIIDRALTGLTSGDLNELSAGRVGFLWAPLVHELIQNPQRALLGSGRYGIMNMEVWNQGRVPLYSHAHNMYLDCVLDMGIIGLIIILALFAAMMLYFWRTARKLEKKLPYYSNLLLGCLTSILCYLVSGMTGRTFFPNQGNFYLWIVIGLGFAVTEYAKSMTNDDAIISRS